MFTKNMYLEANILQTFLNVLKYNGSDHYI